MRLMNRKSRLMIVGVFLVWAKAVCATPIFINEIHYDNSGSDYGEGVEVAGPAGTDLSGWSLVFYNGASSTDYVTEFLAGVIPDQLDGFGVLAFSISGIQNGSSDGLALINSVDAVVQFLSYEGEIEAVGGIAAGLTSMDIGVSESSSTPGGFSLQLIGSGSHYEDFSWAEADLATFSSINVQQSFIGSASGFGATGEVALPSTTLLFGIGVMGLMANRKRRLH